MSVSVVLYVYNGGSYLEAALESILRQSYSDLELCVVDDGSTDRTPDLLAAAAARDGRVRIERQDRHGSDRLHETFNNALAMTRHDLIAIANADDIWRRDKLEIQVRAFADDPHLDICYHDATFISGEGRVRHGSFRSVPSPLPAPAPWPWQFVSGNPIPNPTVMFHRSILRRIGLQEVGQMHDHQFWFKATVHGCRFLGLPDRLIRYRVHDKSQSTASERKELIRSTHRECAQMMVDRYGLDLIFPQLGLADDADSRAWAWSYMGALHWSKKARDAACNAWTESVRVSSNPAVLTNLGVAALQAGDKRRAGQLLRTAAAANVETARLAIESPSVAGEIEPEIWFGPAPLIAELVANAERGEYVAEYGERPDPPSAFMVVGREHTDTDAVVGALTRAIYQRCTPMASLTVLATSDSAVNTVVAAYERIGAAMPELADILTVDLQSTNSAEVASVAAAYLLEGAVELTCGQVPQSPAAATVLVPTTPDVLLPG